MIIRVHLAHDYTDECHQRRVHRSIKWPTGFATAGRLSVGALPFVCSSPKLAVYFIIFQLLWLTTIAPLCMNSFYYLGRLAVTRRLLPLTLLCEFVCLLPPKQTPPPQAEPSFQPGLNRRRLYNIKPWLATPRDSANRLPSINWIVQYSRSIDIVFYYTDSVVHVLWAK